MHYISLAFHPSAPQRPPVDLLHGLRPCSRTWAEALSSIHGESPKPLFIGVSTCVAVSNKLLHTATSALSVGEFTLKADGFFAAIAAISPDFYSPKFRGELLPCGLSMLLLTLKRVVLLPGQPSPGYTLLG